MFPLFGTGTGIIPFSIYTKVGTIIATDISSGMIRVAKQKQKELIDKLESDEDAFLLDVRSEEEYEESHIPNSKLLNIRNPQLFMDGLQDLDKSKNYYVYCHSGARSVQACQIMETFGFNNLSNLLGGISEWTGSKNN